MKIPTSPLGHISHSTSAGTIRGLTFEMEMVENGEVRYPNPTALGFQLPAFQRPFVWTLQQQERFIESIFFGFDIGRIVINKFEADPAYDHLIIDGQQRLTTIENFLKGKFQVFGYFWQDLDRDDQRRFYETVIPQRFISTNDERILRDLYDRMNFGGTVHTEDQRAVQ